MSLGKSKKFIFFWLPYDVKYTKEAFFPALYLAMNRFPIEESIYIGKKDIFELSHSEGLSGWLSQYNASLPTEELLISLDKRVIDEYIFQELEDQYLSNNLVWKHLLTERYLPLEIVIDDILKELVLLYEIEGIITWCNIPSLSCVAKKYDVAIIHNEMGPLREPYYVNTAYFDFQGVNGNTEFNRRFENTEYIHHNSYPRESLLALVLKDDYIFESFKEISIEYDVGVPLQVEDDSNLIAFGSGFDNLELIKYCKNKYNKVSIRKHPLGQVNYNEVTTDLKNLTPIEFIKQCNIIVSINSSLAFEATLHGRRCSVLGDSPFKSFSFSLNGENNVLDKLNFAILNYIIPFDFLFDISYYRWRLSMPTEDEIRDFHLNFYIENKKEFFVNYLNEKISNDNNILDLLPLKYKKIMEAELKCFFVEQKYGQLKQEYNQLKQKYMNYKECTASERMRLEHDLSLIKNSKSWRYTRFIRKFFSFLRKYK